MLRHPRIVKVASAAELSWRLGRQVLLSEDLAELEKEAGIMHASDKMVAHATDVASEASDLPLLKGCERTGLVPSESTGSLSSGQRESDKGSDEWVSTAKRNSFGDAFRNYEDSK